MRLKFLHAINAGLVLVSASLCAGILVMISAIYVYLRSVAIRTEMLNRPLNAEFFGASFAHLIFLIPIVYLGAARMPLTPEAGGEWRA